MEANNILFRASSIGHIMTEPQGKSNYEIWQDAVLSLKKTEESYNNLKNKDGKMGIGYLEKIAKLRNDIPELEKVKDLVKLSETTKTHLIDKFVSYKYGRNTDIKNKYITKGLEVEEDSITLFSQYSKTFYRKNEERLTNVVICFQKRSLSDY